MVCYSQRQAPSFLQSSHYDWRLLCFLIVVCLPITPARFHTQTQAGVCPAVSPVPGAVSGHRADVLRNSLDGRAFLVVAS